MVSLAVRMIRLVESEFVLFGGDDGRVRGALRRGRMAGADHGSFDASDVDLG